MNLLWEKKDISLRMKTLKWILISGIPLSFVLCVIAIVTTIQHWPINRFFNDAAALLLLSMLVLSWVFALKYKESRESDFDSI